MVTWPLGCLPGCCNPPSLRRRKARRLGSWEHFLKADGSVGIRGCGPSLEIALERAAEAMFAAVSDLETIHPKHRIRFDGEPEEPDRMLTRWLTFLRDLAEARNMLFSRFGVKIRNGRIHAHAWGEKVNPSRHRPAVSLGAITHKELWTGSNRAGEWIAQCVVEIHALRSS